MYPVCPTAASSQMRITRECFSGSNLPKKNSGVGILKILVQIRNNLLQGTMCVNFQAKSTALTPSAQIYRERDFEMEFQKFKSEFGISTSKIAYVLIFRQNGQIRIFPPKFGEIAYVRAIFWF